MTEGGVSKVVTHAYCPSKVGIQSKSLADCHRDGGYMHHMFHSGADMIVVGSKEDLGLVLKPPVRIGMDYGGKIAEKASPDVFYPGIHTLL